MSCGIRSNGGLATVLRLLPVNHVSPEETAKEHPARVIPDGAFSAARLVVVVCRSPRKSRAAAG